MRRRFGSSCLKKAAISLFFLFFIFFSLPINSADAKAWGDAGIGFYPFDSHIVAPNGLVYDPLARIQINLNIGSDNFYVFTTNSFYAEKASPGVTTNSNQGGFDFTKRQYDLELGLAAKPFHDKHIELRAWTISLANLNRGTDPNKPTGFKDGFATEGRYYYENGRWWGYGRIGYYFSKELVEPDGEPYKPGLFGGAEGNYDIFDEPKNLYAFGDITFINANCHAELGLAWRPFTEKSPDTEFRATYGEYFNFAEKGVSQNSFIIEAIYYFKSL